MQLACFSVSSWGLNSYETGSFPLGHPGSGAARGAAVSSAWPGAGFWGNIQTSWPCRTCPWCPGSSGWCCGTWQCLSPGWIAAGPAACPEGAGRLRQQCRGTSLSLFLLWGPARCAGVLWGTCSVPRMVSVCPSSARLLRAQGGSSGQFPSILLCAHMAAFGVSTRQLINCCFA